MGVKRDVFASQSERENFYKLSRRWGDKYRVYHNLPFLNVFDTRNLFDFSDWRSPKPIALTELELARLKKTSVDYTICDERDRPILSIEFDGLQQGFNVGTTYYPDKLLSPPNPWRRQITELKLKVAVGSLYPFFVVGSRYFRDISRDAKLMIVDGIIGEVLASKAVQARISEGFDPEEYGYSPEGFESLSESYKQELIQDWAIGVEVSADMQLNPISTKRGDLQRALDVRSWSVQHLYYPNIDHAKTPAERAAAMENAVLRGTTVDLHTSDCGSVRGEIWLPNFNVMFYLGYELGENIATLLALQKLQQKRAQRDHATD